MFQRSRHFRLLLLLTLPVLLSSPARAQEREEAENPRVERIRFEGVEGLETGMLRGAIVTEATRCLGVLFEPLCRLTDWRVLRPRRFLDREELARDELRLAVFYARRGYREAAVASELRPTKRGVEVVFQVDEGEPTLIESIEVTQTNGVLRDRQIARAGLPRQGQPLNLVQLDTALAHLAARLGERGYLDAVIHDTVEVATAARSARVEVRIDPQARTTVGALEIRGNQNVADRTITNALQLREGRVLRTNAIVASQRSLYESNLFHEARISVPEQPDSVKQLVIEVREAPPRAGRIGGGFNTIEFFQTEARFTHYNWMGGGRRFDVRGAVGNLLAPQFNDRGIFRDVLPAGLEAGDANPFLRPTWQASADLMQPAFRASANTLGFSVFTNRRLIPGIVIDRGYGAELSVTRRLDDRVPATLSYRFEQTAVDAGDLYFCVNYGICDMPTVQALRGRHRLSPASAGFFADRADHPLAPTRGFRARLDVEHASGLTASGFHYNRIAGEATHYIPFGVQQRRVLAGRVRAGWVRPLASTGEAVGVGSEEQSLLHPRKRFYAGGSRSVRGFRENQLGPRILTVDPAALRGRSESNGVTEWVCDPEREIRTCDPNADGISHDAFIPRPVGGTSVLEASVEYRFPFWGRLQGAVFLDGAAVGAQGNGLEVEGRAYVTPGVGARFATPVGPIRVDLGIRPTVGERLPVVTEIVDGDGERRLVRLDLPRDYDPTEARGGFLGQALARLTLHLSIGEAF